MTVELLARAQAGDGEAFARLVEPYRRELQVYCYRFLGSVADAEDALQDTLVSAWQGLAGFEGRASLRTWLYRVASSRCVDALRSARRRPPVSTSEESVTSALKRARATLERHQRSAASREPAPPPGSAAEQQLVDRLTRAFEAADVDGIVALLTEDVWVTMPPLPLEYSGRELAGQFLRATAFRPGWTARLIPTRANGQPAFGFYAHDPQGGRFYTVGLLVLTLSGIQISAMTRFDPATLPRFGLPAILSG